MADTPTRNVKAPVVRDYVNRPARPESAGLEQRRNLWEALSAFITSQGGWVTSLPGVKDLRSEVPQGSALPAKLIELGYSPRHCGASTRITPTGTTETITKHSTTGKPITRHHSGMIAVDVIEITLGG